MSEDKVPVSKTRVLIADDDQPVVDLLAAMLQNERYDIFRAYNGKEAVDAVHAHPMDVVLLDMWMPVMDGLEALRQIKESDQSVQVLLMTGQPDMGSLKQIIENGASDYIVKPFKQAEMLQTVRSAVEKRKRLRGQGQTDSEPQESSAQVEKDFDERTLQLRETQIKYKQIIDNSNDAIMVVQDGILKFVNPRALEMTGYGEDELLNTRFDDLILSGKRIPTRDGLHPSSKGEGETSPFSSQVLRKDGGHLWVEIHTVKTEWDDIPATLNFIRDVTSTIVAQEELRQSMTRLRQALDGIIQAMALSVETRDPYTAGHQRRVADLAATIAEDMGVPEDKIEGIRMAALIHDLGKLSLPSDLLSKSGRLTETEYNLIRNHSEAGYEILKQFEFPWPLADIVVQHHERMNGSGYPSGISGEEILLEARILGVADVVEAMASHRPYRPALGVGAAVEEISKQRGVLYDAGVVDSCVRVLSEKEFSFDKESVMESVKSYLVLQSADGDSKFFPLTQRITIGRGSTNDICINDSKASRLHAVVSPNGDAFEIEDMDSRNGTSVNGEPIKKLIIKHGDEIKIGDSLIKLHQERRRSQIAPTLSETQTINGF